MTFALRAGLPRKGSKSVALRKSNELDLAPKQQMLYNVVGRHRYLTLLHLRRCATKCQRNVSTNHIRPSLNNVLG